ncbi:DUF4132 domain-containing protein [Spirillospora sp. NPDC029432]|uniref:DUF4132 domain-containing protein n=1 Tax=Spirillospora sp. NPDC029432 TaxID=3154599 RepID=UPI003456E603
MGDQRDAARDEDVLVLPADLRRRLHPRRDGHPAPAPKIAKGAAERLREQRAGRWSDAESLLARVVPGPEWADAVRWYLGGAADPAGAAVVALLPWKIERTVPGSGHPNDWVWKDGGWVRKDGAPPGEADEAGRDWVQVRHGWSKGSGAPDEALEPQYGLVDAWSAEHGLAFAACALVELSTLAAGWAGGGRIRLRAGAQLWLGEEAARRMRSLLAAAGDDDYREAEERLAAHRRTLQQKVVASYLVPTRQDWRDECQKWLDASSYRLEWLCAVVGGPERSAVADALNHADHPLDLLVTLADSAGADALPVLARGLDRASEPAERKRLLKVIGLLPCDGAFRLLLDRAGDDQHAERALNEAMTRFPARALRLLAEAGAGAAGRLAGHVRAHPERAAALLPDLPAASRTAVEAVIAADPRVPEAGPEELPALLVRPPWTRGRKAAEPAAVTGLEPPADLRMAWREGEREAWSAPVPAPYASDFDAAGTDWEREVHKLRVGGMIWAGHAEPLMLGPDEVFRPLLAGWPGEVSLDADDVSWMKCVVGRFGEDALSVALRAARDEPDDCAGLLLPYLNAEVAALMAGWLDRKKDARRTAVAWFARHGAGAAGMLVPAALGKAGRDRARAERALRLLAGRLGAEPIVAAAREYGAAAAAAIEAQVSDPLGFRPDRMPDVGAWAAPGPLPQILLRGRERALPAASAGHVVTMLAMSRPGEVHPGVAAVRGSCDGRSLAAFSRALFERWEAHGAPAKDGWALDQLAWLGDDETVRALAAAIVGWPGDGGHRKAVRGLDVLAETGTDVALTQLDGIARRVRFKGLKARARDRIAEIAANRGLTTEQLADRMVPDFGLDADGGMTLDYGPRRFTVGFDAALVPFVLDGDGRRRKALPRPAAADDPELAPAAYQRFASVKKMARAASADQIRRLERAMVMLRRWTAADFRELFVAHPLVWHIARRLVWVAEEDGAATAFRVAEDRTFADVRDDAFALSGAAAVRIAHPLDLGGDLAAWREALEDYEILQPFPQIERATYALTAEERGGGSLARFEGLEVRTVRVLALRHRGWQRTGYAEMSRALPAGRRVLVELYPGLGSGRPEDEPEQRLDSVRLSGGSRLGELDPVTASEIVADLTSLTAAP